MSISSRPNEQDDLQILNPLAINERAIRSYRACGFVEEGRWREHYYHNGAYVDAVSMGLLRSEWEAQRAAGYGEG